MNKFINMYKPITKYKSCQQNSTNADRNFKYQHYLSKYTNSPRSLLEHTLRYLKQQHLPLFIT